MDTIECILTRRSIRKYTDRSVADDVVKQLLQSAMAAPSSANQQPWHFVVIRDRTILSRVSKIHTFSYMLDRAALAILVCEDPTFEVNSGRGPLDCSAATMNILLAAHALGLGAVWVGIFPVQERIEKTRSLLDIPEHIIPIALVSLGYADEKPPREDRFKQERVHYDCWKGGRGTLSD
jgi:nitroreductase